LDTTSTPRSAHPPIFVTQDRTPKHCRKLSAFLFVMPGGRIALVSFEWQYTPMFGFP
jgi:hypothetical protein